MSVFPALEIKTLVFVGENGVTFPRYNLNSFIVSLKSAGKNVKGKHFVLILQR